MKMYTQFLFSAAMLFCGLHSYADSIEISLFKPLSNAFWNEVELYQGKKMIRCSPTSASMVSYKNGERIVDKYQGIKSDTGQRLNYGEYKAVYTNIFGQKRTKTFEVTNMRMVIHAPNTLPVYEELSAWDPDEPEKYDSTAPLSRLIKRGDTVVLAAYHGGCFGGQWEHTTIIFKDSLVDIEMKGNVYDGKNGDNLIKKVSTYTRARKYLTDFERSGINFDGGDYFSTAYVLCFLILNNKQFVYMGSSGSNWNGYENLLIDFRLKLF